MNPFELYEEIKVRAGWMGGTPEEQRAAALAYCVLRGKTKLTHDRNEIREIAQFALQGERVRYGNMTREDALRYAAMPSEARVFGPLEVSA